MKAVVVLAGLAACFPEPRGPRDVEPVHQVPPPGSLQAKPLGVGQWAVYEERAGGKRIGLAGFAVERVDTCGTWVRVEVGPPLRDWRLCIDADNKIAIAQLHGVTVDATPYAGELEALRTRIVPPELTGAFSREDVSVPAGHFEQTLRVANTGTWLHPDVPLGGAVQIQGAGGRIDVLVAYSDQPDLAVGRNVLTPPPPASGRVPLFLEIALGSGWISNMGPAEASQLDVRGATTGLVISPTRDLILDIAFGDNRRFMASDDVASRLWRVAVGERYSPFRTHLGPHGPFEPDALFLDLTVGYTRLDRAMDGVGNGFALTTGVGWQLVRARDWAVAVHGGYDLGYLDGNVGVRQALDLTAAVQLFLP